jgi:hypothetical protein
MLTNVPDTFEPDLYQITVTASLAAYSTEASGTFSVTLESTCSDSEYWVICNLSANLARSQPVTYNFETLDVHSQWTALNDGLYQSVLGTEENPGYSACTEILAVGEIAYM